jgi:polyhydroxyalkanoate synthesis regulator phasin
MNEQPFDEPLNDVEGHIDTADDLATEDRWYPGKYTRRLLLAGLGAAVTVVDTAGETVERLIERGESVSNEWTERVNDMRRDNSGAGERVKDYARTGVNVLLDKVGVPNKGDVDTINMKLNILSRKLDEIQLQQVQPAAKGKPASGPEGDTLS